MQGIMPTPSKRRALTPEYVSPNQLTLEGFETPFSTKLNQDNRWVVLAHLIPWDEICNLYLKQVGVSQTGRTPLNPRVVIGSLIIKHLCNLDDRETVDQISENMYMQYFLGYSSFNPAPPFDASLFVEFRKRLGLESVNAINEKIVEIKARMGSLNKEELPPRENQDNDNPDSGNKGRVIFDATACPQDIAYPTDLDLLSDARVKLEHMIDRYYDSTLHTKKPRTYRKIARKVYLNTAQKRNKSRKVIRKSVRQQLNFVKRNLKSVNKLLDAYPTDLHLKKQDFKDLLVIHTLYDQQKEMFDNKKHTVEDRIVSIHQPHVRPIVRGKSQAKVEFGAKIHVSIIDGISFLDELSWDAFNEGSHMMDYVEKFKSRFGHYPRELLADQIYCTRANRAALKELGIKLLAKPLGRPSAVQHHVSPGERNPIEGKFGQAKTAYGLNRIKARLTSTSESWIACIILVLNLVKLAGAALPCLMLKMINSFSARVKIELLKLLKNECLKKIFVQQVLCNSHMVRV
jgi:IS5 family transposase